MAKKDSSAALLAWLALLKNHVEDKPMLVLRLSDEEFQSLSASRKGVGQFTTALPHSEFENVKTPTLCLDQLFFHRVPVIQILQIDHPARIRQLICSTFREISEGAGTWPTLLNGEFGDQLFECLKWGLRPLLFFGRNWSFRS
jgi:hypothetical protein